MLEEYPQSDFLFVLDHKDDITFYPNQNDSVHLSYYQLKTDETTVTIAILLNNDWIAKLYNHLLEPDVEIDTLGLITIYPVKLCRSSLTDDKTKFCEVDDESIEKIKRHIADKENIPVESVDLSKLIHLRTPLNIRSHNKIVETELGDFLHGYNSCITIESEKAIFTSIWNILSSLQQYEGLSPSADFTEIKTHKGFSKTEFDEIIKIAIDIHILPFEKIISYIGPTEPYEKEKFGLAYSYLIGDYSNNDSRIGEISNYISTTIDKNPIEDDESILCYLKRCKKNILVDYSNSLIIYKDTYYIELLVILKLIKSGGTY